MQAELLRARTALSAREMQYKADLHLFQSRVHTFGNSGNIRASKVKSTSSRKGEPLPKDNKGAEGEEAGSSNSSNGLPLGVGLEKGSEEWSCRTKEDEKLEDEKLHGTTAPSSTGGSRRPLQKQEVEEAEDPVKLSASARHHCPPSMTKRDELVSTESALSSPASSCSTSSSYSPAGMQHAPLPAHPPAWHSKCKLMMAITTFQVVMVVVVVVLVAVAE